MAKFLLTYSYCRALLDGKTRHAMRLTDDWLTTLARLRKADETVCLVNVTELDSMQQRRESELRVEVEK
jgi:hypothetical protein